MTKSSRDRSRSFGVGLLAPLVVAWLASSSAAAASELKLKSGQCEGVSSSEYVCGPSNTEELVRLDGTPWVFASQYAAPFLTQGAVTVIHQKSHEWTELSVAGSKANFDRKAFADCPKPLTPAGFRGHGMTFGPVKGGKALLYAINHGAREAVEVFEVSVRGESLPGFRWVGCIPSPDGDSLNTLAVAPDGALVATKFFELKNTDWYGDMMAKRTTGQIFEWRAGRKWSVVPRTFLSGPNGVVTVDQGRSLIVAEWGGKRLHKLSRDGTGKPLTMEVAGYPDNIHPAANGRFLVVAQTVTDMGAVAACLGTNSKVCGGSYDVLSIDPQTLALQSVQTANPDPAVFGFATSALDVGPEIWIGSLRGNKILILKK